MVNVQCDLAPKFVKNAMVFVNLRHQGLGDVTGNGAAKAREDDGKGQRAQPEGMPTNNHWHLRVQKETCGLMLYHLLPHVKQKHKKHSIT